MGQYSGPAELLTPDGDAVEVLAILESHDPTYTSNGSWGGELRVAIDAGDPFFNLMAQPGVRLRVDDRIGDIFINSCTNGGVVAQIIGSGDPPF